MRALKKANSRRSGKWKILMERIEVDEEEEEKEEEEGGRRRRRKQEGKRRREVGTLGGMKMGQAVKLDELAGQRPAPGRGSGSRGKRRRQWHQWHCGRW